MAREAYPYLVPLFLIAIILTIFGAYLSPIYYALASITLLLALFVVYFFRDPERAIPVEKGICVAPADGRVTKYEQIDEHTGGAHLISIFLSPLDVHINRAPIAGKISRINYIKGRFMPATRAESSLVNEQNVITIEDGSCRVVMKQIAGIVARRCVLWKQEGEQVAIGERLGLIKFSSRTDLILPIDFEVLVKPGDRVKGGVTIIGRRKI